jgi:hypothetical protein
MLTGEANKIMVKNHPNFYWLHLHVMALRSGWCLRIVDHTALLEAFHWSW